MVDEQKGFIATALKKAEEIMNQVEDPSDFNFPKSIEEDPLYSTFEHGWKDRPFRLTNNHLAEMARTDMVIAAIIKTYQNKVASHAILSKSDQDQGFQIVLKDEDIELEKIKAKIKGVPTVKPTTENEATPNTGADAETIEKHDWELERKARLLLKDKHKVDIKKVQDWILYCGHCEKKPWEHRKWNFESALRAWVWDSLTFDLYAMELVPDQELKPSFWFPVDGATIKYTSNQLDAYKDLQNSISNLNILYPEDQIAAMDKQETLVIDPKLLKTHAYRYAQVIQGRIERVFTEDELSIGIRNVQTDIYSNGYGQAELDLLISIVTGHLNAEYYNQSYFTQGFSAKGILHIQSDIGPRKLEALRQSWQHLVKGAKNSFQTPIFSGSNEVKWIPLTQNHEDIGFEGWMRYLIRIMCAIYQIESSELGLHLKDEGEGGSFGQTDTDGRYKESKERGLIPLLRHFERFITEHVIAPIDDRFKIIFTGVTSETRAETLERQKVEVTFKKTINEIRAEDNRPPIEGGDIMILDPIYLQILTQFTQTGKEATAEAQEAEGDQPGDEDNEAENEAQTQATEQAQEHEKDMKTQDQAHDKDMQSADHDHAKEMQKITATEKAKAPNNDMKKSASKVEIYHLGPAKDDPDA